MSPQSLSLKQRLAALSSTPSASSSPDSTPKSPLGGFPKRARTLLVPPWSKRPSEAAFQKSPDMIQDVIAKMIFQAGVDFETRPMVIVNASALPDPRDINYDLLLSRILSYLNLYVESDYTVVFFAAGGRHTPGWNWVWKAYRGLSRKYRKNLKRLYVVHPSFFTKMLFSFAGAIISPKFFQKISYIKTLSELAHQVPITQIDIPPAVYQENLKHEKSITLPIPTVSSTFGVPLEDLMGYDGEKGGVPRVVKDAIQFLRDTGMEEEGLFRRSPPTALLKAAQDAYDRGNVVSLETFGDPHLAAVLLKKYVRDLPEPLFPESLYNTVRKCPPPTSDPNDMTSVMYIREILLPELAPCSYILLSHVLHLLHEVSLRSTSNRMDAHNLSIVICPNLVKGTSPVKDVQMCSVLGGPTLFESRAPPPPVNAAALPESKTTLGMVIKLCIQRYYEVFDEILDRSEAIPPQRSALTAEPGDQDASVPSSVSASPKIQARPLSQHDDDEDIDDTMLVMPLGPSPTQHHPSFPLPTTTNTAIPAASGAPSAWNINVINSGTSTFKPRHRTTLSNGSAQMVRSMHTMGGGESSAANGFSTSKARSMISIEKGTVTNRKGSISVGRGTTRKSAGAGVEAISITASGFFTAPSAASPSSPVANGEPSTTS